jgi:hypothetical protein
MAVSPGKVPQSRSTDGWNRRDAGKERGATMSWRTSGGLAASFVVAVAVLAAGCARSSPTGGAASPQAGSARVGVNIPGASIVAARIGKATLTVGPGATGSQFTPVVADMVNQDLAGKLSWSAYVQAIPAGPGRTLHIDAFDGASPATVLYSGDATVTIATGATASVSMVLQERNPGGGTSSQLPVIDGLSASAAKVEAGGTVALAVTAHAANPGTALAYLWTASCGSLAVPNSASPTWIGPTVVPPGASCQIQVTVTNGVQGSVAASLSIELYVVPTVVTVPPTGGTVTTGSGVSVAAPAGAVQTATTITVTQVVGSPPPEAANAVSPVYEFGPAGLVFAQPLMVSFPIPPGITDPVVYWSNANGIGYAALPGTIVGNTIQVAVSHFSSGFVGVRNYCALNPGTACQGTNPCRASACQVDGSCLEQASLVDGSACSTGTACTQGETCTAGACGGGFPVCTPTGGGLVYAYPNSWPMISGAVATETVTRDAVGQIVAVEVDVMVTASDPDGDDLTYVWTSDCTGAGTGFTGPGNPTPVATVSSGPGALGSSTVHFRSTNLTTGCTVRVAVRDSWKNGIVPAGSGLPVLRGGETVGLIHASVPVDFALAPTITSVTSPNPGNQVQPGQVIGVGIQVVDPTPGFATPRTPFAFAWTFTGGVTMILGSQVDVTASPGSSVAQLRIPAPLAPGMSATVTVTNQAGLQTTQTWVLGP